MCIRDRVGSLTFLAFQQNFLQGMFYISLKCWQNKYTSDIYFIWCEQNKYMRAEMSLHITKKRYLGSKLQSLAIILGQNQFVSSFVEHLWKNTSHIHWFYDYDCYHKWWLWGDDDHDNYDNVDDDDRLVRQTRHFHLLPSLSSLETTSKRHQSCLTQVSRHL